MARHYLEAPLAADDAAMLRSGDTVFLSGIVYTARDAAHVLLNSLLDKGSSLPFPLEGAAIYYTGPAPAPPGRVIGSAGPTTSYRMDAFAPRLHAMGVRATIGKGIRSAEVRQALVDYTAVYFGATGGAGALLSACIKEVQHIAFPELGPEAIRRLRVENLPLLVINDSRGNELYAEPDLAAAGL